MSIPGYVTMCALVQCPKHKMSYTDQFLFKIFLASVVILYNAYIHIPTETCRWKAVMAREINDVKRNKKTQLHGKLHSLKTCCVVLNMGWGLSLASLWETLLLKTQGFFGKNAQHRLTLTKPIKDEDANESCSYRYVFIYTFLIDHADVCKWH